MTVAVGQPPRTRQASRMRNAAATIVRPTTSPAKLRLLLACLLLLCLAWGALAEITAAIYSGAAGQERTTSEPLSLDAQQLYRSLSDADATISTAFLTSAIEPPAARHRYLADLARSARLLQGATTLASRPEAGRLANVAAGLPVYAGEVESARANARLGLPLGAAYLREASGMLRGRMLPAAFSLYATQNTQLASVSAQATGLPLLVIVIVAGLLALLGLWLAQRWLSRRTHRIVNAGLLAASAAGLIMLVWLTVAVAAARADLTKAMDQGASPVHALASADIAVLRAHADESLTLIDNSGDDSFQADFTIQQRLLGPGPGTLLTAAERAASGSQGAARASAAASAAPGWFAAHRRVRKLDNNGLHSSAIGQAIGTGPATSGTLFGRVEGNLSAAIAADQAVFGSQARAATGVYTGLEAGIAILTVAMAAGCVRGIGRRLAEYR